MFKPNRQIFPHHTLYIVPAAGVRVLRSLKQRLQLFIYLNSFFLLRQKTPILTCEPILNFIFLYQKTILMNYRRLNSVENFI